MYNEDLSFFDHRIYFDFLFLNRDYAGVWNGTCLNAKLWCESGQQVAIVPLVTAKEFENFVVNNC